MKKIDKNILDKNYGKEEDKKAAELIKRLLKKQKVSKIVDQAKRKFDVFAKRKGINALDDFIHWYAKRHISYDSNKGKNKSEYEVEFAEYLNKQCGAITFEEGLPREICLSFFTFIFFNKIKGVSLNCSWDYNETYNRGEIHIYPDATRNEVINFVRNN